jgi:hypothetical protein
LGKSIKRKLIKKKLKNSEDLYNINNFVQMNSTKIVEKKFQVPIKVPKFEELPEGMFTIKNEANQVIDNIDSASDV